MSPKVAYSQKMAGIQSPTTRSREVDHVLDSLTKKKNEVFQSIRGLEDSLYAKKTGLESQYNSRSRTEGSAKDDYETRYSIVREKISGGGDMDFDEYETTFTGKARPTKNLEEDYKSLYEKNKSLERVYADKVQSLNNTIEELQTRNKILVDQFSKDQDEKNRKIKDLTQKLEGSREEDNQGQFFTRGSQNNQEMVLRDYGSNRETMKSHGRSTAVRQLPGQERSPAGHLNIPEIGEIDNERTSTNGQRMSASARGSIREVDDLQNVKEELKEVQKQLKIKTREYDESMKRFEIVRKDLIEKESKIVQLEVEIQEKHEDFKTLQEEYATKEEDIVQGQNEGVWKERMEELEGIVQENESL